MTNRKLKIALNRLEKRVADAKKVLYSNPHKTLYQVLQMINTKQEKKTL